MFFAFLSLPVFAIGGKWSESLNFVYDDGGQQIKTGKTGNVQIVDRVGQASPSLKPFDVDEIHQALQEKADRVKAAGGNIVTMGVTVITKYGSNFEACHKILSVSSKGTAVFVSGGGDVTFQSPNDCEIIGASKERRAETLAKDFDDRLAANLSSLNIQPIKQCQIEWNNGVKKAWIDAARGLDKVNSNLQEALKNYPTPQYHLYGQFSSNYDKEVNEPLRKVLNFGSATDSEQFLLKHLKEEVLGKKRMIGACESVKGKYPALKLDILKDTIGQSHPRDDLVRKLDDHLNFLEVGYIIHLHSTNEVCSCCAYSLANDLLYGGISDQIINMAQAHNQGKQGHPAISPFFLILVSCSQKLPPLDGTVDFYRRVGIGDDSVLDADDYIDGLVKANKAIADKVFLQKVMALPPKGETAEDTSKGKKLKAKSAAPIASSKSSKKT